MSLSSFAEAASPVNFAPVPETASGDFLVNSSESSGEIECFSPERIGGKTPSEFDGLIGSSYCHNDPVGTVDVLGLREISTRVKQGSAPLFNVTESGMIEVYFPTETLHSNSSFGGTMGAAYSLDWGKNGWYENGADQAVMAGFIPRSSIEGGYLNNPANVDLLRSYAQQGFELAASQADLELAGNVARIIPGFESAYQWSQGNTRTGLIYYGADVATLGFASKVKTLRGAMLLGGVTEGGATATLMSGEALNALISGDGYQGPGVGDLLLTTASGSLTGGLGHGFGRLRAPIRGGRGPATAWSGFDESLAGGPLRKLSIENARVTPGGIGLVERHLARFGPDDANAIMVGRLKRIAAGDLAATPTDLRFYLHEIREGVRYRNLGWAEGVPSSLDDATNLWRQTHSATLQEYGLPLRSEELLYVPEALKALGF